MCSDHVRMRSLSSHHGVATQNRGSSKLRARQIILLKSREAQRGAEQEHAMSQPKASRPFMPGYGLPDEKGGKGLLSWGWAVERLKKSHNYWIATTRPDGRPHVMIVWGLWFEDEFWFSTGRESRKSRNLAASPHCVICTENAEEGVILEGAATRMTDPARFESFCSAYQAKYDWDMRTMREEPIYVVRPAVVFGLIEKTAMQSATRWTFDEA